LLVIKKAPSRFRGRRFSWFLYFFSYTISLPSSEQSRWLW